MGTAEANVWEYGLLGVNLKAELASRDGGHDGAPDFQRLARFSFGLGCALIDEGHTCVAIGESSRQYRDAHVITRTV